MEHKGTVTIETERLILRRFTTDDTEVAFHNWTSDDKVTEFLRWPTHSSIETTERIVNGWIAGYDKADYYQWAIVLKVINQPIGTISAVDMDERTEKVHIGYCVGSKWWHLGITSEALAAIIRFFFEEVKVGRVESQHDPNNPNSGGVMKKCGMKYEGTLRKADWSNKGIVDASVYGMLSADYFEMKNRGQNKRLDTLSKATGKRSS